LRIIPEFALAAACCRWPPSVERDAAVGRAAEGIDWPLFARVAKRHRVEALVWTALRRVKIEMPSEISEALSNAASAIAAQNLELTAASVRLKRAFDAGGIPILFLKGISLGQLAFDDIGLKAGWDIDLLVDPRDLETAAAILGQEGYQLSLPFLPSFRPEYLAFWHSRAKESVWRNARGVHVELHTRLADNRALIPNLDCSSPRQGVAVLGHCLPTLRTEELFAYLCVHGASSSWFRLKWIADFAALISSCEASEIDRLYRTSQRLGAGRPAAQALLLASFLFGTKVSANLARELRSDRVNRWLFSGALQNLAGRSVATELDQLRLGTASIHLMQLGLLPGLTYKTSEVVRQLSVFHLLRRTHTHR
jgi:hypothetical protein